MPIEKHHIVMQYTDRPGIVAIYGQEFGEAGINIAGMQIARASAGGQALQRADAWTRRCRDEVLDEVRGDPGRPVPPDRDHRVLSASAGQRRVRYGERMRLMSGPAARVLGSAVSWLLFTFCFTLL